MNKKGQMGIEQMAVLGILFVMVLGAAMIIPTFYDLGDAGIDIDEDSVEGIQDNWDDLVDEVAEPYNIDVIFGLVMGIVMIALFGSTGFVFFTATENNTTRTIGVVLILMAFIITIITIASLFG